MLADMGVVMHPEPTFPPPSNYPRPYARFRAVGAVVRAVFRFRYVCRRKREYLQSKSERLSPAPKLLGVEGKPLPPVGLPRVTFSAPVVSTVSRNSDCTPGLGIRTAARIPTAVSDEGVVSRLHSRTKTAPASSVTVLKERQGQADTAKTRGGFAAAKQGTTTKRTSQKPHQQTARSHSTHPKSHSGSNIPKWSPLHALPRKGSSAGKLKASSAKTGGGGVSEPFPCHHDYDPQLLEYMEGLERYRSRLSNGKPSLHTAT